MNNTFDGFTDPRSFKERVKFTVKFLAFLSLLGLGGYLDTCEGAEARKSEKNEGLTTAQLADVKADLTQKADVAHMYAGLFPAKAESFCSAEQALRLAVAVIEQAEEDAKDAPKPEPKKRQSKK